MGLALSREGAPSQVPKPTTASGTPIWVWLVYGLGVFAALIIVLSILFTAGAHFLGGSGYKTSPLAFVLWGGLVAVALVVWFSRRRA
jgi:hypothetical protein